MKTTALALILSLAGLAATEASAGPIHHRQGHQQGRIGRGVGNDSLTRREFVRLEAEQAAIAAARKKALSDGSMSGKEAARLTRAQNHASRDIYRQKHDGQTR